MEVRKQNYTSLAVNAERKCISRTSDLWQSMQSGSAETELLIFGSLGKAEVRRWNVRSPAVKANLQVTRTAIKSRTCSNSSHVRQQTSELRAIERGKKSCGHGSASIFDRIYFKLAGNKNRHNISGEFGFGPDQTIRFGVTCTCPCASNLFPYNDYGENVNFNISQASWPIYGGGRKAA